MFLYHSDFRMEKLWSNYENMEPSIEAYDWIDKNLVAIEDEIFCSKSPKYKTLCDKENYLKSKIGSETLRVYNSLSSVYGKAFRNQIDDNLNKIIIAGSWYYIRLKRWEYLPTREAVLLSARTSFKGIIKKEIKKIEKSLENPDELRELMNILFSKIILQYRIKWVESGREWN